MKRIPQRPSAPVDRDDSAFKAKAFKTSTSAESDLDAKVVDLFCGVGGMSLGFELAGFRTTAAYDSWEKALDVYKDNLGGRAVCADLSLTGEAIERVRADAPDVIIGGPPCQDFSSAGKRVEGRNAGLTESFAEIVCAAKPRLFVLENVAAARHSGAYAQARNRLVEGGYTTAEFVLDAVLCGAPQSRKRFFAVGFSETDEKEIKTLHDAVHDGFSDKPMSVYDYMGGVLENDYTYYYRHPRNYSRRAIYDVHEPSATIRGVNRPIPPNYQAHRLDAASAQKARPLTAQERSCIQTFPRSWRWRGGKTATEQMIGNAVPVNLGRYLAKAVRNALF